MLRGICKTWASLLAGHILNVYDSVGGPAANQGGGIQSQSAYPPRAGFPECGSHLHLAAAW